MGACHVTVMTVGDREGYAPMPPPASAVYASGKKKKEVMKSTEVCVHTECFTISFPAWEDLLKFDTTCIHSAFDFFFTALTDVSHKALCGGFSSYATQIYVDTQIRSVAIFCPAGEH